MIIFHMCTINDIHMMYGFWDMKRDEQNFLSFWTIFFPFYPPNNPKNQNFEELKKKNPGDIIILHKCTKNHDQMLHCSFDMANNKYNYYFSFWAIFCPFNSLTAQKIKIFKKWKKPLEISSFYICVPKVWSDDVWFLRYGVQQTDGQMDRWKKWHIEVGAPPKNIRIKGQSDCWCRYLWFMQRNQKFIWNGNSTTW